MEDSSGPASSPKDSPRPNPSLSSVDGFSRPVQQSSPTTDSVIASISIPPTDESTDANNTETPSEPSSEVPQQEQSDPALSAPSASGKADKDKSKMWTVILVVLILVVFVGGVYGVYAYQQGKINKLNKQVSSLNTQNSALKTQVTNLQNQPSVSINNQPTSNSTNSLFKIPELTVALTVPDTLSDLTYVTNSSHTIANLSTQNLATLDPSCEASLTSAPLGTVTKTSGQFMSTTNDDTTLIKQYSTYFIGYIKPSGECSTVSQINALVTTLVTDFKNTFSTVQVISS